MGGRTIKKSILAIGISTLFILSILSPFVFGYNIKLYNIEVQVSNINNVDGLMNSSWPMFKQNIHHTGCSPYGKSGNWFKEKWNIDIGSMVFSSPAIDNNGTIYIGSNDWHFYAINSNGSFKWKYKTGEGISSSPAIAEDGTIYVGSRDAKLYAFYSDGSLKWKSSAGGSIYSSPVVDENGIIYVGTTSTGNSIIAFNPNGTKKWSYKTDSDVFSSCTLDNNGTVYCGSHDGYMYAIYTINGTLKWRYPTGTKCGGIGATVSADGTIYFGDSSGYFHAVNSNGTRKWRRDLIRNVYTSPSITKEGDIIVASYQGYVYSFNPDNGSENWKFNTNQYEYISSSPAIDKYGVIYFGDWSGRFYALNPEGNLKWKYKTLDDLIPAPAISEDGTIYFAADTTTFIAKLYAIEIIDDNPPEQPIIDGPTNGGILKSYTYKATTTDLDGDNISYYFHWGDKSNSGWSDFVPSGTQLSSSHTWTKAGTYTVKVKAKDVYDMESEWGELTVTMPRSIAVSSSLILKLMNKFPLLEVILSKIINL